MGNFFIGFIIGIMTVLAALTQTTPTRPEIKTGPVVNPPFSKVRYCRPYTLEYRDTIEDKIYVVSFLYEIERDISKEERMVNWVNRVMRTSIDDHTVGDMTKKELEVYLYIHYVRIEEFPDTN